MDTNNILVAFREVRKIWTYGLVYNISTEGNKITIKEKSMSKRLTVNDAMNAITALTTTVNNLVTTVNQGFAKVNADIASIKTDIVDIKTDVVDIKTDIVRLDKKFDDLYMKNPGLVR